MEVRNRFEGLDVTECLVIYGSCIYVMTEVHDIVQEAVTKTIPNKKNCKKANGRFEEALQIAEGRREVKSKGEKERYKHLKCRVPKNSKER